MNEKFLYLVAGKMVMPLVIPFFWFSRWVLHNKFRRSMKSAIVGRPALLSLPFVYAYLGLVLLSRAWRRSFDDYALPWCRKFVAQHYSKGGLGYANLAAVDGQKAEEMYRSGYSRIAYYLENNKKLLACANSDSFLDVACGRGQNIQELSRRFPDSRIRGFDINEDAVNLIKAAERNNNVSVEVGSFLDASYLERYKEGSYDWIIFSHALGFITADSIDATIGLRKELISSLARIARKGLIVLEGHPSEDFRVMIEQNTRCWINSDYTRLFDKSLGELYMLRSESDWAYCLVR